jgi:hypothetical protein
VDKKTWALIGGQKELIRGNPTQNGWERMGDHNEGSGNPWMEGSYMTKVGKKYYLQYANPGTGQRSYNDGCYESSNPLGPFTLAKHNPFSYHPEGFTASAGHSATFLDKYGNMWHVATSALSVRHSFERRLHLYPSFCDADGVFWTYTGFGDWPRRIPNKKITGPEDLALDWYLLSYDRPCIVSSTASADHRAQYAVNENIKNWWSAATGKEGESFEIKLAQISTINAVQVNFADEGSTQLGHSAETYYQYRVEVSNDEKEWTVIIDKSKNTADLCHEYIELEKPAQGQFVRVVNVRCPPGAKFSLYGFRVFGKQDKAKPAEVKFNVKRGTDTRDVEVTWTAVPGAVGYNVRYGAIEGKLYHNYIAYGQATARLTIHSLHKTQSYRFTVDAFNEAGVTRGTTVITA